MAKCGWGPSHPVKSILMFSYPGTDHWRIKVFPSIQKKDKSIAKYLQGKGAPNRLYFLPGVDLQANTPIWITEGEKKALKMTQEGFPCIGLGGVWSWRSGGKGYQRGYGRTLPDLDLVNWLDRKVTIVFDSDAWINMNVTQAEMALAKELQSRGARVFICRLKKPKKSA
jgi:putative DNA primase/helicase